MSAMNELRQITQRHVGPGKPMENQGTRWDSLTPVPYHAAAGGALDAMLARKMAPIVASPTPFPAWNEVCRGRGGRIGLAAGWFVLVAGRSGFGKTQLAAQCVSTAVLGGEKVAFHSLEMVWDDVVTRVMSQVTGEPAWKLEHGKFLCPHTHRAAQKVLTDLWQNGEGGGLLANEKPISRLADVLDGMTRQWEAWGARLQIVDYLQLAWVGRAASMHEQIVEISHATRNHAQKLGVTLIGLSQFNRETSCSPERPRKEGLMGGSALENDSDQTLLLDHSRQWKSPSGWHGFAVLDKNRHGPMVDIPIRFCGDTLRMTEDPYSLVLEEEQAAARPAASGRRRG
jgi:replicative DNA helicase